MYVSVLLIVLGWAVAFGVRGLYGDTIFVAIAFHLRVVLGEEPWLARTHGATWDDYTRRVRRWV
jgi:protein-S-isoprenylcysteine O-methyltransferase Ste14